VSAVIAQQETQLNANRSQTHCASVSATFCSAAYAGVMLARHMLWWRVCLSIRRSQDGIFIDWVKVLRPNRHKIGHFGDVLPSQSLSLVLKTKTNTKKQTCFRNKIYYNMKINTKLKPGLVASYDLRTGNGTGLFWKE